MTVVPGEDAPLNPVDVERRITDLSNRISNGVRIVSDLRRKHQDAEREYKKAHAIAFTTADAPQQEKKEIAYLATIDLKKDVDDAYAAYAYARDLADALKQELMAYQSIGKLVGAAYNAAGFRG